MNIELPTWDALSNKKFIPRTDHLLEQKVKYLKESGKRIVSLNGSFDLLHAGHLYIIQEAAKQGDVLIIALNSDSSIRGYKGATRPIISLMHRIQMIAALESVDFVTYFDEADPCAILQLIQPHIHVNGAEYGDNCIEADTVRSYGGTVHLVDRIPLLSTSDIITRIVNSCAL